MSSLHAGMSLSLRMGMKLMTQFIMDNTPKRSKGGE